MEKKKNMRENNELDELDERKLKSLKLKVLSEL